MADERRMLAICQDILYCSSHGRLKTPKHTGLAMSVHHLTGSKQIIAMLNRLGHCVSYDETQILDTSLASEVMLKSSEYGVVIPSIIRSGPFIQAAADNLDFTEETLDGKHTTHVTTLVLYQRGHFSESVSTTRQKLTSEKKKSLQNPRAHTEAYTYSSLGKKPSMKLNNYKLNKEWFKHNHSLHNTTCDMDLAWVLLRLCPTTLFEVELNPVHEEQEQIVPSWSGFNALVNPSCPLKHSIGYCPIIEGTPTEYSTVYTVMKTVKKMMESLNQKESIITFDLAIYCKAKEIQMRNESEFENTIVRLGGFHIALNYLAVIGKRYENSGLEELMIESGVYGSCTTEALLKGKSYNRGVRAHKLTMEALLRLQWKSFSKWLSDNRHLIKTDHSLVSVIRSCIQSMNSDQLPHAFPKPCEQVMNLQPLFSQFKEECGQKSQLFLFWNSYI